MILINGKPNDSISAQDRGLHYGDGVFETIAVLNGQSLCWQRHMDRLVRGCERLGINCPPELLLQEESGRLCSNVGKGVLKLIVTRGTGGRGYQPAADSDTTRIISLYDWPDYPHDYQNEGVRSCFCEARLGHNPQLAEIKHLNRLEQVILQSELASHNVPEGIALDISGHVIEGVRSNIFSVTGDTLTTPDLSQCGIAGIIRQIILENAAELGLKISVGTVTKDDLFNADEIFFCNSIIGVWPVIQLEQKQLDVGHYTNELKKMLSAMGAIVTA